MSLHTKFIFIIASMLQYSSVYAYSSPCEPRDFGSQNIVCVCNATYCDSPPPLEKRTSGIFQLYQSSKSGKRFFKTEGYFDNQDLPWTAQIMINPNEQYQSVVGFGGHFTDTFGIAYEVLNSGTKRNLMRAIFSEEDGNCINLCRVPLGSTDFSIRPYSYADEYENDYQLNRFSLALEDYWFKIPLIKEAIHLTKNKLKLIASTWSPPLWMKTARTWEGRNYLKTEHYQTYADYHVKFLDAYRGEGINFWGITTGNEPSSGNIPFNPVVTLGWESWRQADWLAKHFGPTIRNSSYKDLKIIIHDDQRFYMPLLWSFFSNDEALKYADGVGVHWYYNSVSPPSMLLYGITPKKDLFLVATEAANGWLGPYLQKSIDLGSWERGEAFADDIFDNLEYNAVGWLEWNLAINLEGGFSYINHNADASIVINTQVSEFYKQPMYYVLGHFSKFVPTGSRRILTAFDMLGQIYGLRAIAFQRPDNGIVLIVYNSRYFNKKLVVKTYNRGQTVLEIEGNSIMTLIYW